MLSKKKRSIEIKIVTKNEKSKGRVSFSHLSNVFSSLQNIFNEVGDYFAGESYRETGPSKSLITKLTELELIEAHHSDLTIVAELPNFQQTTLTTDRPLGIIALENLNGIFEKIDPEKDIGEEVGKIIKEDKHKTKILKSISEFWPEKDYEYSIKLGEYPVRKLNPLNKALLDKYLEGEKKEDEEELIGPLVSLTVVEPLTFHIGKKPKLKCVFTSEIEELAKKYIGKVVKIRGRPHIFKRGGGKTFENVNYIKPVDEWIFQQINYNDYSFELKDSLIAKVDFIDRMVVLENEDLNILCISDSWDECIEQFEEFFIYLWEEFALASDEELTMDGRVFKNKLKGLVVGS